MRDSGLLLVAAFAALGWLIAGMIFDNLPPPEPRYRLTLYRPIDEEKPMTDQHPFPTDDATLERLLEAIRTQPASTVAATLDEISREHLPAGVWYHEHNALEALIAEVQRLRAGAGEVVVHIDDERRLPAIGEATTVASVGPDE